MDNRPGAISTPNDSSVSSLRNTANTANSGKLQTTSTLPAPPSGYPSTKNVPTSMMDVDNTTVAEDRSRRATSVLSMDDIEAAQALEGLRTGMPFWSCFVLAGSKPPEIAEVR